MAEIPKDVKKLLFGMGIKWHATASMILDTLGLICLILGIVAAAMGATLGLSADHWILIAIAFMVFGLSAWFVAYHAAREGYGK